jgi:hypothetical protein
MARFLYANEVDSPMYPLACASLDISHATCVASSLMENPKRTLDEHKEKFLYLHGTSNCVICYQGDQ